MASGTLYTYPDNFRAYKALVAANYSNAKVKVVSQPPEFVIGETNKSKSFLSKFPVGKVPAFETSKGEAIFEATAIAYYLSDNQLKGVGAENVAHVLQWSCFADNEILPSACAWLFPSLGVMPLNKQASDEAKSQISKVMEVLNNVLLTRTFLVGERVTLADISVGCTLLPLYKHLFDPSYRKSFGNVNRWFTTLINQPQFKSVIGEVNLCEKMLPPFDAKKYNALVGGSGDGAKKEAGGKKEKPQKQAPQKQTPKKKEEEPAEEADATEQAMAAEPKQKDPFESYPKGSFNMDEFKRTYSNEDTDTVALPYFWEHFDKEHYSVWYCEYKFPKELTLTFMSCNLIAGMFQRLEKLRKNAFASVCLFGSNNDSTISGVWIWRGHDLAFTLTPDWQIDYESYEWKKLDADDAKTKTLVDEYFSHEGNFDGKKFNQGKIFK